MEYVDQPKFVTLKLAIQEVRDLYHGANTAYENSKEFERKASKDKNSQLASKHNSDAERYNKLCVQFIKLLNGVG